MKITPKLLDVQFSVTCRTGSETAAARECLRNIGYAVFYSFDGDSVAELEDCVIVFDKEDISRGSRRDLHFDNLTDCLAYHYDVRPRNAARIAELKAELAELEAQQ